MPEIPQLFQHAPTDIVSNSFDFSNTHFPYLRYNFFLIHDFYTGYDAFAIFAGLTWTVGGLRVHYFLFTSVQDIKEMVIGSI